MEDHPRSPIQQVDGASDRVPALVRGTCPVTGEEAGWDLPPGMVRPPARVRHHLEGVGDFVRMGDYSDCMLYRFYKGKRLYRDKEVRYHPSVKPEDRVIRRQRVARRD